MENTITKEQAKQLAVRYNAFNEAMQENDTLGRVVWGEMLDSIQNEIGVILVGEIHHIVIRARKLLNKEKEQKEA